MGATGGPISQGFTRGLFKRYLLLGLAGVGLISTTRRYEWGLVPRPHYGYGLLAAAREASALGIAGITALEFGVAGGNGLLELQRYAKDIHKLTGVAIEVVGFDSGVGLPSGEDYRDLPHRWTSGDFSMDVDALRDRLTSAQLVLGQINETLPEFVKKLSTDFPVGFAAIDVDLWSSTRDCLHLLRIDSEKLLPRVWFYFDDIVETIPDVGELLAIDEFNATSEHRKLRQPFRLRDNIALQPAWAEQMFQAHLFDHPRYTQLITPQTQRELPLK